jgi:PHD/YefM family antitoxin component YafN of YafNO toxin-antitoxin module
VNNPDFGALHFAKYGLPEAAYQVYYIPYNNTSNKENIMPANFTRDEMISATVAAKNFGRVVTELAEHRRDKTAVVKNNEITAVILPVEEYEYMADIVEFVEHLEIYDLITKRKKTPGNRIPLDSLLQEEGIAL